MKLVHPQENFEDLIINIRLEGDCNGVYISKKTREGFEVRELKNRKSNVRFSWGIDKASLLKIPPNRYFSKK